MTLRSQAASMPYTSPNVDHGIAAALGLEARDALADLIAISLRNAIRDHPNSRHAMVFAAYHGIQQDGTTCTTAATFDEIASLLGCSRVRASSMYYRAAAPIFARLSNDLLAALKHLTT